LESNFVEMSFERAVELFREWGFRVEEGPGDEEVTLILEGPLIVPASSMKLTSCRKLPRLPCVCAGTSAQ